MTNKEKIRRILKIGDGYKEALKQFSIKTENPRGELDVGQRDIDPKEQEKQIASLEHSVICEIAQIINQE